MLPRTTLALVTLAAFTATGFAGPLAPPVGPIASTGKTMSEVEPRIAINSVNTPGDADSVFKITQSGSYYLTGNIAGQSGKHAIQIAANNVTVDLSGFTIQAGAGSLVGVVDTMEETETIDGITVKNGTISGFSTGIGSDWANNGTFADLKLTNVGNGITFRGNGTIDRCVVVGRGPTNGTGFSLDNDVTVSNSRANNFGVGFGSTDGSLIDCDTLNCQTGFYVSGGSAVRCQAKYATSFGFSVGTNAIISECQANTCGTGMEITGQWAVVRNSVIERPGSIGIRVAERNARIEHNTIIGGGVATTVGLRVESAITGAYIDGNVGHNTGYGIVVNGTDCTIIRNSFGKPVGSQATYQFVAGNRFGPIVRAASGGLVIMGSVSASTAGSFTTTDPNSNISY